MNRWFLLLLALTLSSCSAKHYNSNLAIINYGSPREPGQENVLKLSVAPIQTVRVAFIGLGRRGRQAIHRYTLIEGVEIVALCDLQDDRVKRSQKTLTNKGLTQAAEYSGEESWKRVCERDDIDLVYICTDWFSHTPIAVYAMERGKHVAIEVPAATTVDECWQLVDTAEKMRRHCMMLENCCYDFFELTTLNMAQNGVFGEIIHGEGGYIHDLRNQLNWSNWWKTIFYEDYTGNPYPTHGIGPICQAMNIHRGDKMSYLVSISSDQFGISLYLDKRQKLDSTGVKKEYKLGDINTTIIKTEKGKTIMLQHNVTSPRPYSRGYLLSGIKGFVQKYPDPKIALEPNTKEFLNEDVLKALMKEYEHPFIKEIGEYARTVGGHGGMDFIMDYRLIYCLRNGLPLDQDVYDAAEWSCLVELTKLSAINNGMPIKIPDFTRGDWNHLTRLEFAE